MPTLQSIIHNCLWHSVSFNKKLIFESIYPKLYVNFTQPFFVRLHFYLIYTTDNFKEN
jgi:hypothetical protein